MSLFSIAVLVLCSSVIAATSRGSGPAPSPGSPFTGVAQAGRPARRAAKSLVGGVRPGGGFVGRDRRNSDLPADERADRGERRPVDLRETDRASTGQQRVERVAFAASGSRLAATCPRYDRVVVYRVEAEGKLAQMREIQLEGRPVALTTLGDRFLVLETPTGDQRHVEPGWWETFDSDGNRLGGRKLAGYYPDDMAVTPDGKFVLVLSSGQAEGDPKKPLPALEISAVDLNTEFSRLSAGSPLTQRTIPAGCRCRPRADARPSCSPGPTKPWRLTSPCPSTSCDRPDQADRIGCSLCFLFPGFRLDHDAGRVAIGGHRDPAPRSRPDTDDGEASCAPPPRRIPGLHQAP